MKKQEALKRIVEVLRPIMMSFYKKNEFIRYRGYRFDDDGNVFYELDDKCNAKEKFIKDFNDPVASMIDDGHVEVSIMDEVLEEIMSLNLAYISFQSQKRAVTERPDYVYTQWHTDLRLLYHVFIDEEYAVKSLLKVSDIWLIPGIVKMVYAISRKYDYEADRTGINEAQRCASEYIHMLYEESVA